MIFLHTADLHLDASMEAGMPTAKAAERRRELYLAFEALADEAERLGAVAILIAGDLFDSVTPSPLAVSRVSAIIEAHPGIDFILLCGNHDHTARVSLPKQKNLKTFEKGMGVYRYGNVAIYGAEDPSLSPEALGIDSSDCNIVMLHGEVREGASGQIGLAKWKDKGVDYLALGHYHTYEAHELDGRGIYAYSGCPAGRGFDECGEKGFVKLTVHEGKISQAFMALHGRRFHTVKVDITGLSSMYEMQTAISMATAEMPVEDSVKAELVGQASPALLPDVKMLSAKLAQRFWVGRVKDRSTLSISENDSDKSLAGVFMRLVSQKEPDEVFRQRVLSCGLRALKGEETWE